MGLPFDVSIDGRVGIIATERDLVRSTIIFANDGILRGGLLALKLRELFTQAGIWNRYVVNCHERGLKPLLEMKDRLPITDLEALLLHAGDRSAVG